MLIAAFSRTMSPGFAFFFSAISMMVRAAGSRWRMSNNMVRRPALRLYSWSRRMGMSLGGLPRSWPLRSRRRPYISSSSSQSDRSAISPSAMALVVRVTIAIPLPECVFFTAITGTVALAEATARWTGPHGWLSDDQGQFRERVGKSGDGRYVGPEIVEAPAEVLNEGVRGNDDPCGSVSLQSSHRTESCLESPVICLEQVVSMDLRVVEGGRHQLIEHAGVDPVPVRGDLHG